MGVLFIESSDGTVETAMKHVALALDESKNLDFLPPVDQADYTDPEVKDQKAAAEQALRSMSGPLAATPPGGHASAGTLLRFFGWCVRGGPVKQLAAFCGAIVRTIDGMLSTMNHALRRIRALEATDSNARIEVTEKQLELLCDEHRELRKRMTEVERTSKVPYK